MRTPEQAAAELLCPFARTFASPKASPNCQGPDCALWKWAPLPSDLLTKPTQTRMAQVEAETGKKPPLKEAVAWVMDNREALGIPTSPTHGYCGPRGA
jgi:hypothetical protein